MGPTKKTSDSNSAKKTQIGVQVEDIELPIWSSLFKEQLDSQVSSANKASGKFSDINVKLVSDG